jgi:hypothetical protein
MVATLAQRPNISQPDISCPGATHHGKRVMHVEKATGTHHGSQLQGASATCCQEAINTTSLPVYPCNIVGLCSEPKQDPCCSQHGVG